ncbi:toxin-antitoxin system YwqK family antitoxin [Aspergillus lucknowensis]|uniref:MORN repeat protein n=1 Tax=Aspergillus lucknowensis TaxID=176173 RepID=A0ABR4LDR3_9EURO
MLRVNRAETTINEGLITLHQGTPFTGEIADYAANGTLIELTSYENGLEHGPQFEWYPDGSKMLQGQCDRSSAVGEWREWYPTGRLARYDRFNELGDLLERKRWNESGVIVEDYVGRAPRQSQIG